MKKIERYDTTTYFREFPFHLIRNEQEAENVAKVIGDKKVVIIDRSVDMETYQPMIWFAVEDKDLPLSRWLKYVSYMELAPQGLVNT